MRADGQMNMIEGPMAGNIVRFALPLALTGILQQLFSCADVAVVGQFVGTEAMAAVGTNIPIVALIVNFFIGLSLGSTVVIANAVGRQDRNAAVKAVHTSILLALLCGFGAAAVCLPLAAPLLSLMQVPAEASDMAVLYLRIYMLGLPVIVLYNFEAAIFRSVGNTKEPLIALLISGTVNVALNLTFVLAFGMTVDGVSLATVLANAIAAGYLLIRLSAADPVIRVRQNELRVDRTALSKILKIGIPAGIQAMVFEVANIVLQAAINSLGTVILAASSAACNLEIIAYYFPESFGQACTTFVGQNYGAGKVQRCHRTLLWCLVLGGAFTAASCAAILMFAGPLLGIFNGDPAVIYYGRMRLEILFFAYAFSVLLEIFSAYLRGYGISVLPAVLTVCGVCGVRILWILTAFAAEPTFRTVLLSYPVSLSLTSVAIMISVLLLERKKHMPVSMLSFSPGHKIPAHQKEAVRTAG